MSESPPSQIGSYRIVEDLGTAPEGRAYRALDSRGGDSVLLKVLEPPADSSAKTWQDSLARTRRLGRLSHRSLPILYELGEAEQGPFVAFSPPPGVSLRTFVSEGGRVNRQRLVEWSSQLLGLLAEVHSEGLLHGHLGADSVYVGEDGKLCLTGFGLTRLLPDTPEVQPPEQIRGEELSPSSDLYSLAALMKRLGATVEMGGASTEALASDDPLLQVLQRATAEDPRDRFEDAVDMDIALRAAAAEPLEEAPRWVPPKPESEESILSAGDPALSTVMIDPGMLAEVIQPKPPSAADSKGATEPKGKALEPPQPSLPQNPISAPPTPAVAPPPRSATAQPAPPAAQGQKPTQEKPEPETPSRSWGRWVAAIVFLLLLGGGAYYFTQVAPKGADTTTTAGSTAAPLEGSVEAPGEAPTTTDAGSTDPARGTEDPVLQLARLLAEQQGQNLFGAVELDVEDQALMAALQDDLAAIDFPEDDPLGTGAANSLFGENPLLGANNPLLDQKLRERWLASAIANVGPQNALAHLQEETDKLLRGEVDRAEWYEHVTQCEDFCNRVVSGLLFEHVKQVQARPNHLVLFGSGTAEVDGDGQVSLASFVSRNGDSSRFLLIGRSSRSGNRSRNRELSRQRVESVRTLLSSQGFDDSRVSSFWLGYEPPQLSPELARIYGLDDTLSTESLNQSVLVVAFSAPPGSTA